MADQRVDWITADGNRWTLLDGDRVDLLWGTEGRGLPPAIYASDELVGVDGAVLRQVRRDKRRITLPVEVRADTRSELRRRIQAFGRALDPIRGAGRLQIETDDRAVEVDAYYEDGYELEETLDAGAYAREVELTFIAFEPLWRDINPTAKAIEVDQPSFLPLPPLRLAASAAVGRFDISNHGDADAYPHWTIIGPGEQLELVREADDATISLPDVVLDEGEQIEIDTHPLAQTIEKVNGDGDRENLWPEASSDTLLWPLVRGRQTIRGRFEETAAGVSQVRVAYRQRWLVA